MHPTHRRTIAWIAGGVFAFATGIVVWALIVSSVSAGTSSLLIGPLDERSLLSVAVSLAFLSLGVGLWSIEAPRGMLPWKVIGVISAAGASALAVFVSMLTIEVNVTPVRQGGCDTGYVVVERSLLFGSSGTVYRQDGSLIVTRVARTSGDNGFEPFSMGGYAVTEAEGTLVVSYSVNRPVTGAEVTSASHPSFSVPVLEGRTPRCGIEAGGDPLPTPSPTTPSVEAAPVTATAVDEAMRELLRASFAAASGTVIDASGAPIDATTLPMSSAPCTETAGARRELQLAFRTDDNARSIERILAVWDQAGYEKDRAMHEDIRYSESLPVQRMSIKDTTTVDGLIHLTSTSVCVPAG